MADRREKLLAILAKLEVTEGTDAVPTGLANAMQMSNVSINVLEGDEDRRDLMLPYFGHQGVELTGNYVRIQGDVELAGAGAAGTVPAYGALLRACGMSETIDAGVSVEYAPRSDAFESASIYYVQDGVRHIALGCRGTFTISAIPKQIPHIRFDLMGMLGTISDETMPSVDFSGFVRPVPVSDAVTSFSLHGAERIAETVSFDLGQTITPRFLIGEETMAVTDRETIGSATVKAEPLATIDWFSITLARTTGAAQLVHGTAAGNIVQLDAPAVEIGRPSQGSTNGILNYALPLMLKPSAGNDELTLTIK